MKCIFMFDIDGTLLQKDVGMFRLNEVSWEVSQFHPYQHGTCITLNRKEMGVIFKEILQNGHEIGLITKGGLKQDRMKSFFQSEYDINLENFLHFNHIKDKTAILKEIADKYSLPYTNIFLIDNSEKNILQADCAGFNTVYVDNNHNDRTHGTEYIKKLKSTIINCSVSDENEVHIQEKEKTSVISEKHSDPLPLIDSSKEVLSYGFSEYHGTLCPEVKEEIAEEICDPVCEKSAFSRFFHFFSCASKKQRSLSSSSKHARLAQSSHMDKGGLRP